VHRDVKPANIILLGGPNDRRVKLVDFGIGRLLDPELTHLTTPAQVIGTLSYIAPEQLRNSTAVGPASDLYAFGCVLYALLTGKPPFGGTAPEVAEAHLHASPPRLPGVPTELDELARSLLEKDPARRPKSGREVADALDLLRATTVSPASIPAVESRISAAPIPALTRTVPAAPRPSLTRWAPAIVSVGLLTIVCAVALFSSPAPPANGTPGLVAVPAARPASTGSTAPSAVEPTTEASAEPAAETPPEPTPDPAGARAPRPVRHREARPAPRKASFDPRLVAALARRGLDLEDLSRLEGTGDALRSVREAIERGDGPTADTKLGAALEAIRKAPIETSMLRAKLDRVWQRLSAAKSKLDAESLRGFEARYLDLEARVSSIGPEPAARESTARAIQALDAELRAKP
jgi:serine/threonine-protein kinase